MSGPTPRPDMIESMERVLSHIGECAGVKVGDVPALLAWAEECKEVKRQRDALLDAAKDALSGWRYIRETYGELLGIKWERTENALCAAIKEAEGSL